MAFQGEAEGPLPVSTMDIRQWSLIILISRDHPLLMDGQTVNPLKIKNSLLRRKKHAELCQP